MRRKLSKEEEDAAEYVFIARRLHELCHKLCHNRPLPEQWDLRMAEKTALENVRFFLFILSCVVVIFNRPSLRLSPDELMDQVFEEADAPMELRSDTCRTVERARRWLIRLARKEALRRLKLERDLANLRNEGSRAGSLRN